MRRVHELRALRKQVWLKFWGRRSQVEGKRFLREGKHLLIEGKRFLVCRKHLLVEGKRFLVDPNVDSFGANAFW